MWSIDHFKLTCQFIVFEPWSSNVRIATIIIIIKLRHSSIPQGGTEISSQITFVQSHKIHIVALYQQTCVLFLQTKKNRICEWKWVKQFWSGSWPKLTPKFNDTQNKSAKLNDGLGNTLSTFK